MNSLFLTNKNDLYSTISGGVQLCSQEYLEIVRLISTQVKIFDVKVARDLKYRIIRGSGLDYYHLYNVKLYKLQLVEIINKHNIDVVFINKAELIRFSKIIKNVYGEKVKIVLMSHGNETGDFLHELTHPNSNICLLKLLKSKIRLGLNLHLESYFRHRYIDLVCAMSIEEEAIEKWLGAKNTYFFPRLICDNKINRIPIKGRIGFVGTLTHIPNKIALEQVCEILKNKNFNTELRIVGSGLVEGREFSTKYKFVTYLGRLNDIDLKKEVTTWDCFLNPIFWYSKGASMKLAQAIGWNLPIVSTVAGARGYKFKNEFINFTSNNAESFVNKILECVDNNLNQNENLNFSNLIYTSDEIAFEFKKIIERI